MKDFETAVPMHSQIDYTSLFTEGSVVAIVWLPEKKWPVGFVSDSVESLLGYSIADFLERKIFFRDLIHPEDNERISREFHTHVKKGDRHFEQKYRLRKADNEYIWVRDYSIPVYGDGEHITQINGYLYDIDSEMKADSRIRENSVRLENALEATGVGTWEWDLPSGRIQGSSRFAGIAGFPEEKMESLHIDMWDELIHPEDLEKHHRNREEYLKGSRTGFEVKYRLRYKKEKWIWIHDKGRIMKWDADGNPLTMFGSISDISEQREAEAMLEHAEKLGALGRLAAGIAHDMNNQLMKIRGTAELAVLWDNMEHYRESMEKIWQLSDSAAWTIHQLQHFSGEHLYEPENCDLSAILNDLLELLDHSFEKEILIRNEINSGPLIIWGDKTLLNNAFFNICYNAKEAMSRGGTLTVKAKRIEPDRSFTTYTGDLPAGSYGAVMFKDEGAGINEGDLDKIFEPFFTTKSQGALGLGLAKVVSAVINHDGGIQVKSSSGRGTEFTLFFPLVEGPVKGTVISSGGKWVVDNSKELLIIDDEQMICDLLGDYFTMEKRKAVCFTNPLDAVEHFRKEKSKIGLVLLDMLMPELSGREVLDQLVRIKPGVRVIFLSGFSAGLDRDEKNSANIAAYMTKPVKMEELKRTVDREMGRRIL